MKPKLKPLAEQVIVLTGATSGIGLVTARQAAHEGARLVLAARNEDALRELADELRQQGAQARYVVADVGDEADVGRISDAAIRHFGGFDTWINNAAVSIIGKIADIDIEDQRRLFDTNYWGTVYGSRSACAYLRERGGKLINVGRALADREIHVQGVDSAAKAAVTGFTNALRMELERDGSPVSVTLVKPGVVDTPYREHAARYLDIEQPNPAPVSTPDAVAKAILYAAEHHERELIVGVGGKMSSALGKLVPSLTGRTMGRTIPGTRSTSRQQHRIHKGSLYRHGEDLHERGSHPRPAQRSRQISATRRNALLAMITFGAAAAVYGLTRGARYADHSRA